MDTTRQALNVLESAVNTSLKERLNDVKLNVDKSNTMIIENKIESNKEITDKIYKICEIAKIVNKQLVEMNNEIENLQEMIINNNCTTVIIDE